MTERSGPLARPSARPRLAVITNSAGDILAIGPATGTVISADDNTESVHIGYQLLKGQKIVEIDVFEEFLNPEVRRDLHKTHRVDAKTGRIVRREGKLVARATPAGSSSRSTKAIRKPARTQNTRRRR
jgi:hypothetical protein